MKKPEETMQTLGQEYSKLCMQLGDIITKIDLLIEEKEDTKEKISQLSKKAVKLNLKKQSEEPPINPQSTATAQPAPTEAACL